MLRVERYLLTALIISAFAASVALCVAGVYYQVDPKLLGDFVKVVKQLPNNQEVRLHLNRAEKTSLGSARASHPDVYIFDRPIIWFCVARAEATSRSSGSTMPSI